MKKTIQSALILIFIVSGLLLSLPFAPLRSGFGASVQNITEKTFVKFGKNNIKNKKIAQFLTTTLEPNAISVSNGNNVSYRLGINSKNGSFAYNNTNLIDWISTMNQTSPIENSSFTSRTTTSSNIFSTNYITGNFGISPISLVNSSLTTQSNSNYIALTSNITNKSTSSETVRQMGNGGPPPDQIGTLPIGNPTIGLLIMALIFSLIKFKSITYN